jgi:hypothetical protein
MIPFQTESILSGVTVRFYLSEQLSTRVITLHGLIGHSITDWDAFLVSLTEPAGNAWEWGDIMVNVETGNSDVEPWSV